MRTTFPPSGHRRTKVPVGLCVAALLLVSFFPAHASTPIPGATSATHSATPRPTARNNHTAGSQIAQHEGTAANHNSTSAVTSGAAKAQAQGAVHGMDVSGYQGTVDWAGAYADGARFAYIKATESTTYTNPYFAQQYNGAAGASVIRAAYHFALPDRSDGASQAGYFVDNGGGWTADGATLPPALDMEYNPYGDTCYGLSRADMAQWVKDFSDTVHARTARWPAIYTSTSWWSQCTGDLGDFSSTNPLWVARYASTVGPLPHAWSRHTFWQYASSGTLVGDQNLFNGTYSELQALARRSTT
jgi:GH25 family lysozyme M1 (1,4-beta-N-acetylmuramidase)